MKVPTTSSIVYQDEAPATVSEATRSALEGLAKGWSGGEGSVHPHQAQYPGVLVDRADYAKAAEALRSKAQFITYIDNTAVDYPDRKPARFTVVTVLLNMATQERLLLKAHVAEGESIPTLTHLWKAADWAERETFDMFGVPFDGHPDLTRIYMPQDYDGYPMRKDFPLQGHLRFQD